MVKIETFRKLALSLRETSEHPHFDKTAFKVGKKIFATYDTNNDHACIKLSEVDQSIYLKLDDSIFFAVPNKWGKLGWTFVNLKKVGKPIFMESLTKAYREVAPKKILTLSKK